MLVVLAGLGLACPGPRQESEGPVSPVGTGSGWSVLLITIDTFRIAAVEQLKVYAKIMGVPFTGVGSKQELRRALQDFADCDAIFVDTGGRSQRDGLQMSEIYRMFGGDDPIDLRLHFPL